MLQRLNSHHPSVYLQIFNTRWHHIHENVFQADFKQHTLCVHDYVFTLIGFFSRRENYALIKSH